MPTPMSITDEQAASIIDLFRLLGEASRLKIILACLETPMCVSDIAETTALSPSLVSHHLRLLRGGRLLRAQRQGKQIFYVAADDHVRRIIMDMVNHANEPGDDGDEIPSL